VFNTPEFQALRREYLEGVLERCAHMRDEAEKLGRGDEVDLKALRQEIHKCRGSGGFYGFASLSQAAALAEDQLVLVIDGEAERDNTQLATLVIKVADAAQAAASEVGS
jgi:chemotaxis protein histidine kinase CheA